MKINRIGRYFLYVLITSLPFYSCSSDHDSEIDNGGDNGALDVRFASSIAGEVINTNTRAFNTQWSANDAIGVYMKNTGKELAAQDVVGTGNNNEYYTSGSGNFFAKDINRVLQYPTDGASVDFIAYYPFDNGVAGFMKSIDISDQSDTEKLDILYSDNSKGKNSTNRQNKLHFVRKMAKLVFKSSATTKVEDLTGLKLTVKATPTKGALDLVNGSLSVDKTSAKDIQVTTKIDAGKVVGEFIVFPGAANYEIVFDLPSGESFKQNITSSVEIKSGERRTYNVSIKDGGGNIEEDFGQMEKPVSPQIPNTSFVTRALVGRESSGLRNYEMLYDETNKFAYWIAYPLHATYIGDADRGKSRWRFDPSIDKALQANVTGKSYTSLDGDLYDRGHQIPSGDRTFSQDENQSTFYMSNITVQQRDLNQGVWATLEGQVRNWTKVCDTMYVVTGAMLTTTTDKKIDYRAKDNNGVELATPKYYYKALAQKRGDKYYTIAYKLENKSYPRNSDTTPFMMTLKKLEDETGFIFFPRIDDATKSKVESIIWK